MYSVQRITDPDIEPVDLDTVKEHLRIDTDEEDSLIGTYIQAAREAVEQELGRAIIQQTWRLTRAHFPRSVCFCCVQPLLLPRPRLIGITNVKYWDTTGTLQTLDPSLYAVAMDSEPARIEPLAGWWPVTACRPDAVQVTYSAGYGSSATAVPACVQLAILMLTGHFYDNREPSIAADSDLMVAVRSTLGSEVCTSFTYENATCRRNF